MHLTVTFLLIAAVFVHDTVALKYLPIGCFEDRIKKSTPRPLPDLIKNFRGNIDWYNHNKTIDACAEEAKKNGYLYFAIQFYGECWSGPMAHLTFDRDGPSTNCISGVGRARANFVYMLTGEENECASYNVLDSADRSKTHFSNISRTLKCDYWSRGFVSKRWNRFDGAAGQTMAEGPVEPGRCQTLKSGWMEGKHPKVVDGIESRRVCFSGKENTCERSTNIRVRNCGKFYVYFLPNTPGCLLRYCGNGVKKSPSMHA